MVDSLPFEKWHGTGNDFVLASHTVTQSFTQDIERLAKALCDRHFGVGADGFITVGKSEKAKFRMRMWNPDGTESEMCGNGIRCVAAHLVMNGIADPSEPLPVETGKGIVNLDFPDPPDWIADHEFWVRADLGEPGKVGSSGIEEILEVPGVPPLKFTEVNLGNPHAVVFVDHLDTVPLEQWGPLIENYTARFPFRVNVEFAEVAGRDHVRMRVWERGAGITLSCGSGTAAIQVAAHLTGRADDRLIVDVPGGRLVTEYTEDGRVLLTGPAVRVFAGEWFGPESR